MESGAISAIRFTMHRKRLGREWDYVDCWSLLKGPVVVEGLGWSMDREEEGGDSRMS